MERWKPKNYAFFCDVAYSITQICDAHAMAASRKRTIGSSTAFDIRVAIAQLDTWLDAYHPDTRTTPTYTHLVEARAHLARIREGTPAKDARAHKSAAMQHIGYALGLTKPKART